jgi:hypothetical protein
VSDGTVREAVLAWMRGADIDGISHWYADEPWFASGGVWPPTIAGSIGFIHIDETNETRIAFGGQVGVTPTGQKMVLYRISLVLAYRYQIPPQLPDGDDESAWVGPLDTQLEAIKERIRHDPTFGCGAAGPIWQAGQDLDGNPSIHQTRDLPVLDPKSSRVISWNRIEIPAAEIITA